ncbi:MAG: hypothetical protein ACFB22_04380 [Rhodothalassiaceae bacterium]
MRLWMCLALCIASQLCLPAIASDIVFKNANLNLYDQNKNVIETVKSEAFARQARPVCLFKGIAVRFDYGGKTVLVRKSDISPLSGRTAPKRPSPVASLSTNLAASRGSGKGHVTGNLFDRLDAC